MTILSPLLLPVLAVLLGRAFAASDIYIGGIFPAFGVTSALDAIRNESGIQHVAAFIMAIKEINNKTDGVSDSLLPNTTLRMAISIGQSIIRTYPVNDWFDGTADAVTVNLNAPTVVATVLGGLDDHPIAASLSLNAWNKTSIVSRSRATGFADKNEHPLTLQMAPSQVLDLNILLELIAVKYRWERISVFFSTDTLGVAYGTIVSAYASIYGVSIIGQYILDPNQQDFSTFILAAKESGATIFLLLLNGDVAATLLRQSYLLGMLTEGTQILAVSSVTQNILQYLNTSDVSTDSIMKGFLGVATNEASYFADSSKAESFMRRFRNQPSTMYFNGSQTLCDNATDDTGYSKFGYSYVYQTHINLLSNENLCLGFDSFKVFNENGSNIDPSVLYTYDAVYAVARALDELIRDGGLLSGASPTSAALYEFMSSSSTSFNQLATGNVSFVGSSGGIRESGFAYKLLNYQASGTGGGGGGSYTQYGLGFVGEYSDAAGWLLCGQTHDEAAMGDTSRSQCIDPIYRTNSNGGSDPPSDRQPDVIEGIPGSGRYTLVAFASLGTLQIIAYMVFVAFHWNAKKIKSAQPKILLVILAGSLMGMLKVFCVAANVSVGSCVAQIWLQHVSYRLIFRTLSLKLWRVHKVVNASNFKRVIITENTVLAYVAVDIVFIIIILGTLTGLQISSGNVVDYQARYSANQRILQPFCAANTKMPAILAVTSVLFIFEGFYLFAAIWYTFVTRAVPSSINESKSIAPGLLLVVGGIVVITAVLFSLSLTVNAQTIIENVAFLVMIGFSNGNYFGSKVWEEYKHIIVASASVAPQGEEEEEDAGKKNVMKALAMLSGKERPEKSQQQQQQQQQQQHLSEEPFTAAAVTATVSSSSESESLAVVRIVEALKTEKTIEGRMNLCRRRIANWKEMLILLSDENFKTSRQGSVSSSAAPVADATV